jgi:nucleoside-diphosphate kinase
MQSNLTLALIKPHAHLERKSGAIIKKIEEAGFGIIGAKLTQFRREGAEEFYIEHKDKDFYKNLVQTMSASPVWALVLAKANAVDEWRKVIGSTDPAKAEPGTIRHEFGDHSNLTNNAVHGSADGEAARREIDFFFGTEIKLARSLRAGAQAAV